MDRHSNNACSKEFGAGAVSEGKGRWRSCEIDYLEACRARTSFSLPVITAEEKLYFVYA
jgi:hypothetical protein